MRATKIALYATLVIGVAQAAPSTDRYTVCNDYYTVGASPCRAKASTPVARPAKAALNAAQQAPKITAADPVQQYLDNHGKPPREFVEFYLNPTPENANTWVQTFRAQQARANAVSQAWQQAEQAGARAAMPANPVLAAVPTPAMPRPASPTAAPRPRPILQIGGYATPAESLTKVTYYFSAICPFCTRLKPDLAALTQAKKSKLIFTCVDLTPISNRSTPNPANRAGLPCDWRMPQPGEVEALDLNQTPILLVQAPGQAVTRLTGLVPREALRKLLP
jgi:hypothetical protein